MAKQEKVKIKSPEGVLGFSHVGAPDTEGTYADDKYKVRLIVDKDDPALEAFTAKCKAYAKKTFGKVPKNLQLPAQDGDKIAEKKNQPELRGKMILAAKTTFAPGIVDAKTRQEVPASDAPRSGDRIKFSATLSTYTKTEKVRNSDGELEDETIEGVNLYLNSILLIKRNAGGGGNPAGDFDDDDFSDDNEDGMGDNSGDSDDGDF